VKSEKNQYEIDFGIFWLRYPRKENKANALKWFKSHKPNNELLEKIMIGLDNQLADKNSCLNRKDKKYIPLATSWLNGEMWEDIIEHKETSEEKSKRLWREIEEEERQKNLQNSQNVI
jgi:hypothetical protein